VVKAAGKQGAAPSVDFAFDLYDPRILDAVDQAALKFCRETNDTATVDLREATTRLRKLLKEGLPKGQAVRYLARKVRDIYADPFRAQRIVATEVPRALHGGRFLTAKESGLVTHKSWLASTDACERCLDLDSKVVALAEPFWVDPKGGPYAVVLYPPLHPFCMCDWEEEL
jgi:hypothetical protein